MLQETLKTVFLDIECFIYTAEKDQMYCSHLSEVFIRGLRLQVRQIACRALRQMTCQVLITLLNSICKEWVIQRQI